MDAVQKANSGHPGMPMGMADVSTILFKYFLKFNPKNPSWINRDRFVLSAGHGSMLLYSLLYLTGYKSISLKDIKNFIQLNSICAGHPEYQPNTGIETTTGPLELVQHGDNFYLMIMALRLMELVIIYELIQILEHTHLRLLIQEEELLLEITEYR